MTKFTPVGFTLALDRELGESGIKVGGICPGGVKTEFAIGKSPGNESRVAESGMPDPKTSGVVLLALHTVLRIAYY